MLMEHRNADDAAVFAYAERPMPIYVYKCADCDFEIEEFQNRYSDPPPDDAPKTCTAGDGTHKLERALTTCIHKWHGEMSNDGIGGWKRQGDGLVRVTKGKERTKYGEGA